MTVPNSFAALVLGQGGLATTPPAEPTDFAGLLEYRQLDMPEPGDDQVLIRVVQSPVNPSDLLYIRGEYGLPRRAGTPAGFEGVGTVVKTGAGTGAAALNGRRVAFLASGSGAWAEYAVSDAASCIPVPPEIGDNDAAALIVNPLTAIALVSLAVDSGSKAVVVTAAHSQLGRLMIEPALAHELTLIGVVRRDDHAQALLAEGVQHVLNSRDADFAMRLAALCRREKPRILLDAVGDQIAADIFTAMPAHSRWISYGLLSASGPRLPVMRQFVFDNKRIEGFWLSRWLPAAPPETRRSAVAGVLSRFGQGLWRTETGPCLGLKTAISQLPEAIKAPGKVMIAPDPA